MARPVRIVTDSTADVAPALKSAWDLTVVPLTVHMGGETYRDAVDLTAQQFYERLAREKELPRTSQPSPALFEDAYRSLLDAGYDVASIHISSGLSGTYNSATIAAQHFPKECIRVLDSRIVSLAHLLVVRRAALLAQQGADLDTVADAAVQDAEHGGLFAMVNTLEYLQRGGRIGGLSAFLGGLLSVKPILGLKEGKVIAVERVRTRPKALDRLVRLIADQQPFSGPIIVGHGNDLEGGEQLRKKLAEALPGVEILTGEIGPVVGTHAGPHAVGAGFIRQP